jgi:hypothetical protein
MHTLAKVKQKFAEEHKVKVESWLWQMSMSQLGTEVEKQFGTDDMKRQAD